MIENGTIQLRLRLPRGGITGRTIVLQTRPGHGNFVPVNSVQGKLRVGGSAAKSWVPPNGCQPRAIIYVAQHVSSVHICPISSGQ